MRAQSELSGSRVAVVYSPPAHYYPSRHPFSDFGLPPLRRSKLVEKYVDPKRFPGPRWDGVGGVGGEVTGGSRACTYPISHHPRPVCTRAHTHTRTHTHTHTRTHARAHTHPTHHSRSPSLSHTHTPTPTHPHTHTQVGESGRGAGAPQPHPPRPLRAHAHRAQRPGTRALSLRLYDS